MTRLYLPLLLALAGCNTIAVGLADRCDVTLDAVQPASAEPGAVVTVTGHPLTTHYDTAAYFGSARAAVPALEREGCETCDTCRADNDCSPCGDCDECDATCAAECVEVVSLVVPEVPAGPVTLKLLNAYGESNALDFEVTALGGDDTGADDTGATTER